jgi:protein TonB
MIKAKELTVKNLAIYLIMASVMLAAYFVGKSYNVSKTSVPVFMGEEIVVQNGVKAVMAVKGEVAVKAEKAVTAIKAETMPTPKTAGPLPIVPPTIAFKVLPIYPSSALEKGLEGITVLSAYVGLDGRPGKIETKISSGVTALDEAAVNAVAQWKFNAANQGGSVLASWFEIPVRFAIK